VWQLLDTRSPRALIAALGPLVRRWSDCLMSTGRAVGERHLDLAAFGGRFVSFFPPVDTHRFAPSSAARARARRELGLSDDNFVVGSVGNLNPQKGHLGFVRAAAEVKAAGVPARFVVLGAEYAAHRQYSSRIRALAGELGLTLGDDLRLHDPGARVPELAPALDLFWLTSEPRSEGIPTAVLEAMALGIPVIATDVGSVSEAVRDGETGHLVAPLAPELVAERTIALWRAPERRRDMSRRSRAVAEREFSLDECADTHVRAFEIALRHHAGAPA
jgi:glycosyltransferase involved in cell wall biosynthesis